MFKRATFLSNPTLAGVLSVALVLGVFTSVRQDHGTTDEISLRYIDDECISNVNWFAVKMAMACRRGFCETQLCQMQADLV